MLWVQLDDITVECDPNFIGDCQTSSSFLRSDVNFMAEDEEGSSETTDVFLYFLPLRFRNFESYNPTLANQDSRNRIRIQNEYPQDFI